MRLEFANLRLVQFECIQKREDDVSFHLLRVVTRGFHMPSMQVSRTCCFRESLVRIQLKKLERSVIPGIGKG
jgi:hypothetical protein